LDFIYFLLIALLVLSGIWIIYLYKLLNSTKKDFTKKNQHIGDKLNIFSKAINQSPSVAVITDLNGSIEYVNPQFTKITGYGQKEVIGCNPRILKSGDKSTEAYKQLWKTITTGGIWYGEFHNKKKDGDLYWESASITAIKDNNGTIQHYLAVKKDITEEKVAQIALKKSENRLSDAQKAAHIGNWEFDVMKNKYLWSDENYSILGLEPQNKEPSYKLFENTIHPEDREFVHKTYMYSINNKSEYKCSFRLLLKNGTIKFVSDAARHYYNEKGTHIYTTGIIQDITEMVMARNKIELALKEKEVLLRELYHRTKNNMQIISSLFKLRSSEVENETVKEVFTEMDNKIQSMSLVHEKLYQSKNLSSIKLKEYFTDLIYYMKKSYNLKNGKVSFTLNLEDISVLIDTATPLGLLFNEVISNAMKHAFPEERKGEIIVTLYKEKNEKIILKIADNGIGFTDEYNYREGTSLGIQTILALGEGQLKGIVSMESNNGVTATVQFSDNIYNQRVLLEKKEQL